MTPVPFLPLYALALIALGLALLLVSPLLVAAWAMGWTR